MRVSTLVALLQNAPQDAEIGLFIHKANGRYAYSTDNLRVMVEVYESGTEVTIEAYEEEEEE